MSIIKHVTLQKIVAHDFRYDPRNINLMLKLQICYTEITNLLRFTTNIRKFHSQTSLHYNSCAEMGCSSSEVDLYVSLCVENAS